MHKSWITLSLAAAVAGIAAAPAAAQQPTCPPGQQPTGNPAQYCENQPGQGTPQSGNNPGAGNANRGQGNVAGFTASSAEIAKLHDDAKEQLVTDINKVLVRNGLAKIDKDDIVITTTETGFIATVKNITLKAGSLLNSAGVPVAVVGCTVDRCPTGFNVRVDFSKRSSAAAKLTRRLYLPQRTAVLRGGQLQRITVKVAKTRANKRKVSGARSMVARIVIRTRDAATGKVVSRTFKTVKVGLK